MIRDVGADRPEVCPLRAVTVLAPIPGAAVLARLGHPGLIGGDHKANLHRIREGPRSENGHYVEQTTLMRPILSYPSYPSVTHDMSLPTVL